VIPQRDAANLLLAAQVGTETDGFVEIRHRLPHERGMGQEFHPARDGAAVVDQVVRLSATTDVYWGAAPRSREAGGADAVARVHTLWVDCDTPTAASAVNAFEPPPAVIVRSGSVTDGVAHVQAY
jgi:hypothetical protein